MQTELLHTALLSSADIQNIAAIELHHFSLPFFPSLNLPISSGYHVLIKNLITNLIPLVTPKYIRTLKITQYPRGLQFDIELASQQRVLAQKTCDTLAALFSAQSQSVCPICGNYLHPDTAIRQDFYFVCPDCNKSNLFDPFETGSSPYSNPPKNTDGPVVATFNAPFAIEATQRKFDFTSSRETKARYEKLLTALKNTSAQKALICLPENLDIHLNHLKNSYPNFANVIDFISTHLTLKTQKSPVLSLPPILLIGPPGIGKSVFCNALATAFSAPLYFIDMASAQTGSSLSGSESYWANTHTGKLFDTVVLGPVANPIFILDEIDKTTHADRNPLAALYQLLEKHTAQHFTDLSAELSFDASHVVWLATANSQETIPEPLLSRFDYFTIDNPNAQQQQTITETLYTEILTQYLKPETPFEQTLNPSITQLLCKQAFSPRKTKKYLECAVGNALRNKRKSLNETDFIFQINASKKFLGFCPDNTL